MATTGLDDTTWAHAIVADPGGNANPKPVPGARDGDCVGLSRSVRSSGMRLANVLVRHCHELGAARADDRPTGLAGGGRRRHSSFPAADHGDAASHPRV